MDKIAKIVAISLISVAACTHVPPVAAAKDMTSSGTRTLEQEKASGALQSSYRTPISQVSLEQTPQANLKAFRTEIEPALKRACFECHGAETAEGEFRIDILDPDLLHGEDVDWWLDVSAALSNGEIPLEDAPKLADVDRSKILEWLASEIQIASQVRRSEQGHSSFRRMTRYEFNYVLQDLLGLSQDFARDLLPETVSEDGFRNSSERLQINSVQFAT